MKHVTLLLCILLGCLCAYAQEVGIVTPIKHSPPKPPLTIDRPDQTESPHTIPVNSIQIETGIDYQWDHYKTDTIAYSYRSVSLPNLLLRYGLSKRIELRIEANYGRDKLKAQVPNNENTIQGIHPLIVGTKIKLCEQKGLRPTLAVLLKVYTPFHTRRALPLTAKYTAGITGAFSYAMSEKLVLDGSAGACLDQYTGRLSTRYSLSQAISLTDRICVFGEVFGLKSVNELAQYGADTGVLYLFSQNLQVDIYAGKSISYEAIDLFVGAGIGLRIPSR